MKLKWRRSSTMIVSLGGEAYRSEAERALGQLGAGGVQHEWTCERARPHRRREWERRGRQPRVVYRGSRQHVGVGGNRGDSGGLA